MKSIKVNLTPKIKRLEIPMKKPTSNTFTGGYRSVFKGRGMEFDRYRIYAETDDARMIDWKASLRSKQTLVRIYEEERNINIFFLFDVSSSMCFGSTPKLKCEYAAELIASVAFAVTQSGDAIGMAMFTDHIVERLPPMAGRKQFFNIKRLLEDPKLYGGNYDLQKALEFTMEFLPPGTLLIIVSDFIGLKSNWEHYLRIVSNRFDVIGCMISDPRDREIPKGVGEVLIEDPYSGDKMVIGSKKLRIQYEREMERYTESIRNAFLQVNGFFGVIKTEEPMVKQAISFFRKRELEWT
jgi:uncharacterized protein (DUF58 family)